MMIVTVAMAGDARRMDDVPPMIKAILSVSAMTAMSAMESVAEVLSDS